MSPELHIHTYDASSLAGALVAMQEHFAVDSPTFFSAYRAGTGEFDKLIPPFTQHQWADYYDEWLELTGAADDAVPHDDDLAGRVRRDLAAAV